MAAFRIKNENLDRIVRRLNRRIGKAPLFRIVLRIMQKWGTRTAGLISRDIASGKHGIRIRTGNLARSVAAKTGLLRSGPAVRVGVFQGPATKYAPVQELGTKGAGGTLPDIVPRRAKALAIPVQGGPALTPSGVPRYTSPRQFPGGLRFQPFKGGGRGGANKPFAGLVTIQDGVLAYLLLKRAAIKPKHFMRTRFLQEFPGLAKELEIELAKVLGGAA